MSDDPRATPNPEQHPEDADDSRLDDLDPEEEGEDVVGGGYRPSSTSSSRFI